MARTMLRRILAAAFLFANLSMLPAQIPYIQPTFATRFVPIACPLTLKDSNGSRTLDGTMVLGDFNGDRVPDIALVCNFQSQIMIFVGKGDASFNAAGVVTSPSVLKTRLIAGDLNNDGKSDLVASIPSPPSPTPFCSGGTVISNANALISFISQGDGTFGAPLTSLTGGFYDPFAVVDLNGDGTPDLVLSDEAQFHVGLMLGNRGGSFSSATPIGTPMAAQRDCSDLSAVGDFNNDGRPDVLVTTNAPGGNILSLFLNQGNLSFAAPATIATGFGLGNVAIGDFNGDGNLDIDVYTSQTNTLNWGNGKGAFPALKMPALIANATLIPLDLNGDGKTDLAAVDSAGAHFFLSNGDGTFQTLGAVASIKGIDLVADFNGDGKPDLAWFDGTSIEIYVNTTPSAFVSSALNAASFAATEPLAAGSLASLFGSGLAPAGVTAEAGAIPLPPNLGQVSVTIGGFPAPLLYVSPKQINLQVPWEVSGPEADVIVTVNGTPLAPLHAAVGPVSPGIFTTQSGTGQAIAINNADSSLAGPSGSIPGLAIHPAAAGDILLVLCTGLGAVSPSDTDGAASSDLTRYTVATPTVTIGGQSAQVSFSGLAPQFVGVNQLNVIVPSGVSGVVPLQVMAGGVTTSNQVTIAVE